MGDLRAVVDAAFAGVEPAMLVQRAIERHPLPPGAVNLLAVGKAAAAMAAGAAHALGARVHWGLVIGLADTDGQVAAAPALRAMRGDHPMPSVQSEAAGREALRLAADPGGAASLVVLLSGGASALMAVPAAGLTLDDKRRVTGILLRAGVTIGGLNAVRKHLSAIKGGRLGVMSPVPVVTFAISDVVGDDPAVIGSGPTVADPSTFADALAVLLEAGGREAIPAAVVRRLEGGIRGDADVPETPKPDDTRFAAHRWHLVGGRTEAMQAAAREAERRGYTVRVHRDAVVGEARHAAERWLPWVHEAASTPGRLCLISSGETTVRVVGAGVGGRNQEFALAAADALAGIGRPVALASVGTDGIDGPTDAAGAVARSDTRRRADAARLPPSSSFLRENNAYRFFEALGDLVRTGPSGTNVGDLQVCLID